VRLIILILLVYLGYRALKSWVRQSLTRGEVGAQRTSREIDDIMIKCPACDVYFPRRDGVQHTVGGRDLSFCSPECRDHYLEQHVN
jgi:uncharacterized protein